MKEIEKEIELVLSLINMVSRLPEWDFEKLYAIRKRAEMIIRKLFGDSSGYLHDLAIIRFAPTVSPATTTEKHEMWLSGKSKMMSLFQVMLEEIQIQLSGPSPRAGKKAQQAAVEFSNRIFVVHGRDEAMKEAVARVLEKLGLEPIILHERANEGRTVIEKFTDYSDVGFAVVLLSPDDMAYSKDQSPEDAKPRARQNVIFELGFFIGKLGRKSVLILHQQDGDFEMPSDYAGVLYAPYDDSRRWQLDLIKELKACHYDVDANKLT